MVVEGNKVGDLEFVKKKALFGDVVGWYIYNKYGRKTTGLYLRASGFCEGG